MSAWCPRCQKQVRVNARRIVNEQTREVRLETLCAECGVLLTATTEKPATKPPRPDP